MSLVYLFPNCNFGNSIYHLIVWDFVKVMKKAAEEDWALENLKLVRADYKPNKVDNHKHLVKQPFDFLF